MPDFSGALKGLHVHVLVFETELESAKSAMRFWMGMDDETIDELDEFLVGTSDAFELGVNPYADPELWDAERVGMFSEVPTMIEYIGRVIYAAGAAELILSMGGFVSKSAGAALRAGFAGMANVTVSPDLFQTPTSGL